MIGFALGNVQWQLERAGYGHFSFETLDGATEHLFHYKHD